MFTAKNTPVQPSPTTNSTQKSFFRKLLSLSLSFFLVSLIFVSIATVALFFFIFVPGQKLYLQLNQTQKEITDLKLAIGQKDLELTKQSLSSLSLRKIQLQNGINQFSWSQKLPYINAYYTDSQHFLTIAQNSIDIGNILIQAIEPYQDFLGIKGSKVSADKTTEDRIAFLTQSVEGLLPHLDSLETKVAAINQSLEQIDPTRYPEQFRNQPVRSQLLKSKELVSEAYNLIKNSRPLLTQTSWLLGKDKPRNYFIIFQNDAELRPTGGFWTAYGIIKVDKGKVSPQGSGDIYSLDAKLNSTIPAPRPIKAYHLNVPYFYLRDMNISPDFPTSIKLFLENYRKIDKSTPIDAVVALDTKVLVDIVKVIGRVGVPGFGNFSSDPDKRCDGCPQIIYQLEWLAGRPRNYIETNRKGFLSPLMHSLLANAMGSEKSKITPLVESFINNIYQKHILFYFPDTTIQKAAENANIAGQISDPGNLVDYFHLNDANMSSAKTNLFLKQKIKHEIISQNGTVEHKISVTYTNPSKASNCNLEKGDLCLNASKYRDWFRFYTSKGSSLIKMTGSEVEPLTYEELGKQVFEGFYGNKYPLYASSSLKTSIQYRSSVKASPNYSLFLQKQAGTKPVEYELIVNGQAYQTFAWSSDKTIRLSL